MLQRTATSAWMSETISILKNSNLIFKEAESGGVAANIRLMCSLWLQPRVTYGISCNIGASHSAPRSILMVFFGLNLHSVFGHIDSVLSV